jgi:hypothetical protein
MKSNTSTGASASATSSTSTKYSLILYQALLALLLSSPPSSCVGAAHTTQQPAQTRRRTEHFQPLRRTLQSDTVDSTDAIETTTVVTDSDRWLVEPVVCPGPDCVHIEEVQYYSDSTGGTQYAALCYKPPYCANSTKSSQSTDDESNPDTDTDTDRCPLYVWIDATSHNDILEIPDKYFLREMVSRGFVSCVAKYDDSPVSYLEGCPSFHNKARYIFDPNQSGSLLSQLCGEDGTNATTAHADCNVGLAVHGWGQGAHVAVLAADFVNVTASLQFGNGNLNGVLFVETNVSCVSSENISPLLPPARRRSIVGEEDQFFNRPT